MSVWTFIDEAIDFRGHVGKQFSYPADTTLARSRRLSLTEVVRM